MNSEYTNMFTMDKQQSNSKNLTLQKVQELKKRKEQFLVEFFKSGKFEHNKEKLRAIVLKICLQKYH